MYIPNIARPARGFTLLELILLIVVISVALAGLLLVFSTGVRGSVDPMVSKQALATAEAMLEEVQLNPFCHPLAGTGFEDADPTDASQTDRDEFDDIDDYHSLDTVGVFTVDNTAVGGLASYNVSVTVATAVLDAAIPAADSKLITVTVTGPTGSPNAVSFTLTGYRTDYTGACP